MRKQIALTLVLALLATMPVAAQSTTNPASRAGGVVTTPLLLPDGTTAAPSLSFASDTDTGRYLFATGIMAETVGGVARAGWFTSGLQLRADYLLAWSAANVNGSNDVILLRDAANTLALRNGANAQTFRVGPSGNLLEMIGPAAGAAPYLQGIEGTAPASAPANGFRIFAQDNGAGKTQLMVIFASGAAQQIAIEP